jgi:hypothetical protein
MGQMKQIYTSNGPVLKAVAEAECQLHRVISGMSSSGGLEGIPGDGRAVNEAVTRLEKLNFLLREGHSTRPYLNTIQASASRHACHSLVKFKGTNKFSKDI